MIPHINILLSAAVCLLLAGVCIKKKILNTGGIAGAIIIGMVIGVFGDFTWLLVLIAFLIISVAATKFRFSEKLRMGVAEGERGERGFENVLSNGGVPAIISFLSWDYLELIDKRAAGLLYLCAVASATSDTLASEIGVFSPDAYLITKPGLKVKPGTNGGISLLGTGTALFGAMFIGTTGWFFLSYLSGTIYRIPFIIVVPSFAGFLGCNLDSYLGAVFENSGMLGKGSVNYLSSAGSVIFGIAMTALLVI